MTTRLSHPPDYCFPTFKTIALGLGLSLLQLGEARAQTVIPASSAAPPALIDTAAGGFLVYMNQLPDGVQREPRHNILVVEQQLAGELIDPETSEPFLNEIDEGDNTYERTDDGGFIVEGPINFNQDSDPAFGDIGEAGNITPDDKYPGIPGFGNGGGLDDFAMSAEGFLQLTAGTYRFGVNSDDGFQVIFGVGTNPRDAFAQVPAGAVFEGGRGASNSEFDITIEADGLYPVRLLHWEGNGGASVEFYTVNPPEDGGTRILVNDSSEADSVKAFWKASGATPSVTSVVPRPGSSGAFPRPTISATLVDGNTAIDEGSVTLSLNGTLVDATVRRSGSTVSASFETSDFLAGGSEQTATLSFADSDGLERTHSWSFSVGGFVTLPASYAYPLEASEGATRGFTGTIHQVRQDAGLVPSVERADTQVRGTLVDPFTSDPFDNLVSRPRIALEGVINFEEEARDAGIFSGANNQADSVFPGIPGSEDHDDQFAIELVGYLELSSGIHVFGVNSQDGFSLRVGPDARGLFGTQTLGEFNGVRAVPEEDLMTFLVEEAGLYSFRLLGFESGDDTIDNGTLSTEGSALEFYSIDADAFAANPETATRVLINDSTSGSSIKAFQSVNVTGPAYLSSAFPAPGSVSVPVNTSINIVAQNLESGADVTLKVNGEEVNVRPRPRSTGTEINYTPADIFGKGETVQIELSYGDQTDQWEFSTSTGNLAIMIVNGDEASESDFAVRERLQAVFGFDVLLVDDTTVENGAFSAEEADGLDPALIYVSSTTLSGRVVAQPWHELAVPIVNVEQATADDFQLVTGNGQANDILGTVEIVDPNHPLAAGFSAGEVAYMEGQIRTGVHWGTPVEDSTVVAQRVGNPAQVLIYGIEEGAELLDFTLAPARRVQFGITGDNNFSAFNDAGLKLFDAAISWALGIDPPVIEEPPVVDNTPAQLNAPVFSNGNVTISWEGSGVLQSTSSLSEPWADAADQSNPQTIDATGIRFFRVLN